MAVPVKLKGVRVNDVDEKKNRELVKFLDREYNFELVITKFFADR